MLHVLALQPPPGSLCAHCHVQCLQHAPQDGRVHILSKGKRGHHSQVPQLRETPPYVEPPVPQTFPSP